MRILDRYILVSFAVDFAVMGLLIVGLLVLGDVALKLDEFLEDSNFFQALRNMATYSTAQLPVMFVSLAPILTLVAAMLSLGALGRSGELVAMRASGISPFRVALPIFAAAFSISLTAFAVSETYLPNNSTSLLEAFSLGKGRSEEKLRQLAVDDQGNVFFFERFAPRDGSFRRAWIDLMVPDGKGGVVRRGRIHAESGGWAGRPGEERLVLVGGARYEEGGDENRPQLFSEEVFETDLLPIDVEEPGERLRFESIAMLRRRALEGDQQRHRLILQINGRIAHYLFTSWVLLLIALPLALRVGDRGRWMGLLLTLVVVAAYLGVHQTCVSLGERAMIPPLVAAWFPVALFGSVGTCMFANAQG